MRVLSISIWLGLAAGLAGQTGGPEPDLLARIKAHVGEGLKRLPSYTCLETVERFERRDSSAPFVLVDRLRLEVAMVGREEFYAWPGDSKFEEKNIAQMIPNGTIGSGDFALHAYAVFLSRGPAYTYAGEITRNGRRLIRFDYRVAESDSGYILRVPPHEAQVGYHGSFLVDRETLDLVRLEVVAADIPPDLGLSGAIDVMEYSRVRIGGGEYTLPASSELLLKKPPDIENRNHIRVQPLPAIHGRVAPYFWRSPARGAAACAAGGRQSGTAPGGASRSDSGIGHRFRHIRRRRCSVREVGE